MRKFLLSLISAFCMIHSLNAQKILSDKVESDGSRYIICTDEPCRNMTDKIVLSLSVGAISTEDQSKYLLSLTFTTNANPTEPFAIPEEADLLIRTDDGSVLTLKCTSGGSDEMGEATNVGGMLLNMKKVHTSAILTEADLNHLCTGIIKVRCALSSPKLDQSYYEGNFKKAKLAKFIQKEKDLIEQALSSTRSGSITDGF